MGKILKEIGKDEFGRSVYREENNEPLEPRGCLFIILFLVAGFIFISICVDGINFSNGIGICFAAVIGIILLVWLGDKYKFLK